MVIYALCENDVDGEGFDTIHIISYHKTIPDYKEEETTDQYNNTIEKYFIQEIEVLE